MGGKLFKEHEVIERFEYIGFHSRRAHCRLDLYKVGDGTSKSHVAIISEASDNPGASVTNCIETVVFQVCAIYGLTHFNTTFVEHYGPSPGDKYGTWDLVTFAEWDDSGRPKSEPIWARKDRHYVDSLVRGRELPR